MRKQSVACSTCVCGTERYFRKQHCRCVRSWNEHIIEPSIKYMLLLLGSVPDWRHEQMSTFQAQDLGRPIVLAGNGSGLHPTCFLLRDKFNECIVWVGWKTVPTWPYHRNNKGRVINTHLLGLLRCLRFRRSFRAHKLSCMRDKRKIISLFTSLVCTWYIFMVTVVFVSFVISHALSYGQKLKWFWTLRLDLR